MKAMNNIIEKAKDRHSRIVLCEGEDRRVLQAAFEVQQRGIASIILVGNKANIQETADAADIPLEGFDVIDPHVSPLTNDLSEHYFLLRQKKGITREQALEETRKPINFANLMVAKGMAEGSVAGAIHTTKDVVRSAIQIIGLDKKATIVSSFFLMMLCQPFHTLKGGLIFSDCGLVIDPTDEELANIALAAARSAESLLMVEPKIAMLSFSTSGSAQHESVSKVVRASQLVKQQAPNIAIDEDVQLDAAIVADVAKKKLPNSNVKGQSNVLIFPNLEAGNIGYKLAERIGGAVAIGPLLQGLAKPANDLSRGCSNDDIVNVIAVTVMQNELALEDRG
ncbi:phosphate acetyltransferase [Enterovibrio norvegicus]|uniref:phosphate acetyltransferase n=1 Tax=Enterovibrio norvegicus TaxID=188144 RepID=UPI000C8349B2|nr:phosphate acetyltransferase [Enterovibrio norvegicus]PML77797.1 phosphate acetyltransferase [Enterovibrio norvegicus]